MNMLSLSGAYGALVFVFQQGHFEQVLGFTSSGFIDRFIPILLFCVLFGLSMDYEVFLLTRMREEWLHTHNNQAAVARGLEKTGGVITSAAFLFILVSGSFMFTQLIVTKELGLGITIAVLVDATIIRSLLVPATMQLLGKWNWWFPRRPAITSVQVVEDHVPEHTQAPTSLLPSSVTIFGVETGTKEKFLAPQDTIEHILMQIVAHILTLPPEHIHRTDTFFENGGDSDTLAVLLSAIEQQWGVQIEANDVFDHPVLCHLATMIACRQGQGIQEKGDA